ncbi:MAG: hypothetical protein ACKVPY_07135 [Paracoccaceae bacterium]
MSFRRRDYPELLETMLTSLAGGVAAEAHPFPPPGDPDAPRMDLSQPPARVVVAVYGARNGVSFRFRAGTDVLLSPDGTALLWKAGGTRPDAGTLVEVSYLRRDGPAQLTDFEVGSVARTLVEAIALETARIHAELQAVYEAAFLETATGRALDNVVALVGVERVPAGRARAALSFSRDAGAAGSITIPAGTRVIDAEVKVEYETVETVTLSPAQTKINVEARDVEPGNAPVGADVLKVLPVPIAGIVGVSNPSPASRAATAETDAELRTRARSFLQGSERATLGSLKAVLARQGIQGEFFEPADRPGIVVISPVAADLTPERREQLLAAIEDVRPAGVRVELGLATAPAALDLAVQIVTRTGLPETARRGAHDALRKMLSDYFAKLPVKEDARVNRIAGLALAVPGIEDVTLVSATLHLPGGGTEERLDATAGIIALSDLATVLGDLSVADPGLPTRADLSIRFPAAEAVPDRNAVTAAMEAALDHISGTAEAGGTAEARAFSFGKLLRVLPPPVGQGTTLASWDAAPEPKPALPVDAGVYEVVLFIAQANGLTRVMSAEGQSYTLGPKERLALNSVTVEAEG